MKIPSLLEVPTVMESYMQFNVLIITDDLYHHLLVGEDYVLLDSSVTIPKNSLQECFDVFIVDDSEHEGNESFFLDLVASEQSSLIPPSTVEVVITG